MPIWTMRYSIMCWGSLYPRTIQERWMCVRLCMNGMILGFLSYGVCNLMRCLWYLIGCCADVLYQTLCCIDICALNTCRLSFRAWNHRGFKANVTTARNTHHIEEFKQERCHSSALAMELRLSCFKSSIYTQNIGIYSALGTNGVQVNYI